MLTVDGKIIAPASGTATQGIQEGQLLDLLRKVGKEAFASIAADLAHRQAGAAGVEYGESPESMRRVAAMMAAQRDAGALSSGEVGESKNVAGDRGADDGLVDMISNIGEDG